MSAGWRRTHVSFATNMQAEFMRWRQPINRHTALIRLSLATFPVNSAAADPGIPQVLWQASICWATRGFVGATNTTLPSGNQL